MLKGVKEGISIEINNYNEDIKELKDKLKNKDFLGEDVDFILRRKDKKYFREIYDLVNEYGYDAYILKDEEEKEEVEEEKTLIVKKTVRSGTRIEFDGNIVIVGDVNPGSEIFADGDVYIYGRARGIIHAGRKGDITRRILALGMEVNQIRIGNIYAKGDGGLKKGVSETAYVEDGRIVLQEYKWI
ncbi:septum site-determining protein MinC [Haliovirga abyssi]|uniref:Probable septum site-determining protein MinC n=1 Tax=Haliovirga abyssi TaxID=2996794 RepID=A0AAU9D1P0_9FUSO|nr:septum site-determining protein MinC [Haliovirga abyssi]BDU49894.1 hypothetical protein HLVA_04630 [Haliovirga abyssi]